jgi:hypothetical protein
VEELQAELRALEHRQHETTVALASARMTAEEAEARAAALQRELDMLRPPPSPGKDGVRVVLASIFVLAVFAFVIGSVALAIHAYRVRHPAPSNYVDE